MKFEKYGFMKCVSREIFCFALCAVLFAACGEEEKGNVVMSVEAALTVDAEGVLYQLDCTAVLPDGGPGGHQYVEEFVPFNAGYAPPWLLPDGGGDEHSFADLFTFVDAPAVCEVTATAGDWDENTETFVPNPRCEPETVTIEVEEGQTTEQVIVIDCLADDGGASDIPVVVNECPEITDVNIDNKYFCEGDGSTISLEVEDSDGDEVTCEWTVVGWPEGAQPGDYSITPSITTDATGHDVVFNADVIGGYELVVTCTDVFGECATTFEFPMYAIDCPCECTEPYEPLPDDSGCVWYEYTEVQTQGTIYTACPAGDNPNYTSLGAMLPGGTIASSGAMTGHVADPNDYWGPGAYSAAGPDSRLNQVGIWACNGAETAVGTMPTGEWIGFSVCLDIEEAGQYLVGLAADNRIRFKVNGVMEFEKDSYTTLNFNYWYLQPITLQAGTNIIELEGYNDGNVAAFGAEIAGPYGDLSNDAAIIDADFPAAGDESDPLMIFTTIGALGQEFQIGENSGYECPDGFVLDTCAPELTCVQRHDQECE